MKKRILLPVALGSVVAASMLSACGPETQASTSAASGTKLTVMTPKAKSAVDSVTWNDFGGEPATIDPFHSADYGPNEIASNLCETMLLQQPDASITPNLAQSWTNPDPLHWVYTLRSDVKFWDGKPMTAEDVAFSLNRNLTDPTSYYNYLFVNVKSVAATGAGQVTVTLKEPDYLFNDELASYAGAVVEKEYFTKHEKDFGTSSGGLMCTGPYQLGTWEKGQSITLTKNANYWNTALTPKVNTIKFTFLTEDSSVTAALQSGEIDGTYYVPYSGMAQLKASPTGKLYVGPTQVNSTFFYANPTGPMSNPKLRKALQMSIDWNGLVKTAYAGEAELLRGPVPPAVFGKFKSKMQPSYDALAAPQSGQYEEAKKLVAEAGPDAAKTIVMVTGADSATQRYGLAIEDAAKRIGLKFQLKTVPNEAYGNYLYDPKTRAGVDILYTGYWPNIPDPLDWFANTAVTGGLLNPYGYSEMDSLAKQARGTADPTERATLLAQMQEKSATDLLPMVPGIMPYNTIWMNNRITGPPASLSYLYYPWAALLGGTS